MTLSAWVYSTNIANPQNIWSSNPPFFLRIYNSQLRIAILDGLPGWNFYQGTTTLLSNKWYNLALTYNGNTGIIRGYINGSLEINTGTAEVGIEYGGSIYLGYTPVVGENAPGPTRIANAYIYSRDLTPDEIMHNYLEMAPRFPR